MNSFTQCYTHENSYKPFNARVCIFAGCHTHVTNHKIGLDQNHNFLDNENLEQYALGLCVAFWTIIISAQLAQTFNLRVTGSSPLPGVQLFEVSIIFFQNLIAS